jgi:hypothetical protein
MSNVQDMEFATLHGIIDDIRIAAQWNRENSLLIRFLHTRPRKFRHTSGHLMNPVYNS